MPSATSDSTITNNDKITTPSTLHAHPTMPSSSEPRQSTAATTSPPPQPPLPPAQSPSAPITTTTITNPRAHAIPDSNPDPDNSNDNDKPPTSTLATPSPRYTALNKIFTTALQHVISTLSYSNFSACFPTPAKHAPQILESVWRQITRMLEEKAQREFEDIVDERDVRRGLAELDRVVDDAKDRRWRREQETQQKVAGKRKTVVSGETRGTGREEKVDETEGQMMMMVDGGVHMLPPRDIWLAHLAPYLQGLETEVKNEMQELSQENERLAQEIKSQEQEVEHLLKGVEAFVGDLRAAGEVLGASTDKNGIGNGNGGGNGGGGGWRREVEMLDVEMRG